MHRDKVSATDLDAQSCQMTHGCCLDARHDAPGCIPKPDSKDWVELDSRPVNKNVVTAQSQKLVTYIMGQPVYLDLSRLAQGAYIRLI